jgi:hypothetical protein
LTAPDDWGWAAGSTLYGGVINGFSSGVAENHTHYYLGSTLATPVAGLKVGASFDYLDAFNYDSSGDTIWAAAGYASYQATEKLSFHARAEYMEGEASPDDFEFFALTGTIQYDLWENVISRLEIRWDKCMDSPFGTDNVFGGKNSDSPGTVTSAGESFEPVAERILNGLGISGAPASDDSDNAVLVALQLIYKF